MLILALETSTELGSCALWHDGNVLERICPSGQSHSENLLPLVRELLAESGIAIGQLDAIAFGVGPGAFTGLRVACGAAQGLAVAAGLPLIPISGLEVMAATAGGEKVLALLDARMGEVYSGQYCCVGDRYQLVGEIRVSHPTGISLPEDGGWLACGNAPAVYPELLDRLAGSGISCRDDILPAAGILARVAEGRWRAGEDLIDPAQAAPLYVRDKVAKTVAERLSEGGKA